MQAPGVTGAALTLRAAICAGWMADVYFGGTPYVEPSTEWGCPVAAGAGRVRVGRACRTSSTASTASSTGRMSISSRSSMLSMNVPMGTALSGWNTYLRARAAAPARSHNVT